MAEHGVGLAREHAGRKRQVGVAQPGGVDLDEHFVRLDGVEVDLAQLELAVQLGDDEGGCLARHGGCLVAVCGSSDGGFRGRSAKFRRLLCSNTVIARVVNPIHPFHNDSPHRE